LARPTNGSEQRSGEPDRSLRARWRVKLSISIGARLEGATHAHARKGLAEGVEAAALEHVAILSCPTTGLPAMMMALGWVRDVTRG